MLIKGETFNNRKADLLSTISVSRALIRTINDKIKSNKNGDTDLHYEVIDLEQAIIKNSMNELIALKKWQAKRKKNNE